MRKLCLFLSFLSLSYSAFSQAIGDTITMYIDNSVEINIATKDYHDLKDNKGIEQVLAQFLKHIPQLSDQLKAKRAELLYYAPGKSISIEPAVQKNIYLMVDEKLENTGIRDKAIITVDESKLIITTSDMSKITESSVLSCYNSVIAELPKKVNWSKTLYFQCINSEVTFLTDKEQTNSQIDALELSFGAGAGLVKNKWVGDLSVLLSVGLNHKGIIKHKPYLSFNFLYDFPSQRKTNINGFLNIGYGWNRNKTDKEANILAVELGYLLFKQGNTFDKNTLRLSFNWSPADAISVSPQLYISEGFKQAYPGIRIGFGF